jgi:hypothetical protein
VGVHGDTGIGGGGAEPEQHTALEAEVVHEFETHFSLLGAEAHPEISAGVEIGLEGHAGVGFSSGSLTWPSGWQVDLPAIRLDVIRWGEDGHPLQFGVVHGEAGARFPLFTVHGDAGQPDLLLQFQGSVEADYFPNWPAIMQWAEAEGIPWVEQTAARVGTAVTDALTPAADAATVVDAETVAAGATGGAVAVAGMLALIGGAAGVIWWAHGTMAELQAADDAATQGYIASHAIYEFCMSYVGSWFGNGGLGSGAGQAGHDTASAAIARFRGSYPGQDPQALARAQGARALYRHIFDATRPSFEAAAVAASGAIPGGTAAMGVEGPINRTAWGEDLWRRHGGSLGLP